MPLRSSSAVAPSSRYGTTAVASISTSSPSPSSPRNPDPGCGRSFARRKRGPERVAHAGRVRRVADDVDAQRGDMAEVGTGIGQDPLQVGHRGRRLSREIGREQMLVGVPCDLARHEDQPARGVLTAWAKP